MGWILKWCCMNGSHFYSCRWVWILFSYSPLLLQTLLICAKLGTAAEGGNQASLGSNVLKITMKAINNENMIVTCNPMHVFFRNKFHWFQLHLFQVKVHRIEAWNPIYIICKPQRKPRPITMHSSHTCPICVKPSHANDQDLHMCDGMYNFIVNI